MNRKKILILIVGILAFLAVFVAGRKVYGNMEERTAESGEPAEGGALSEDKSEEKKMDEAAAEDTATDDGESAEEKAAYAGRVIEEAMADDSYRDMSLEERSALASGTLSRLEQDGYITGVTYDEDSLLYSFEYIDGTLGGWRIEDFSGQDGLLPMN